MITKDKVTEIFCIIDEFDKNLSAELAKNLRLPSHNSDGKRYRNRKGRLSESEIMGISDKKRPKMGLFCSYMTKRDLKYLISLYLQGE